LIKSPGDMIAPRLGMAYNFNDRWVVRAGGGLFYQTSLGGNVIREITQNYPFLYRTSLANTSPTLPIIYGDGTRATFESGIGPIQVHDPLNFNAAQSDMRGNPPLLKVPYSIQYNVTLQRQLTGTQAVSVGYVGSKRRNNSISYNYNAMKQMLPPGLNQTTFREFPDFATTEVRRNVAKGEYNSFQASYDKRFSHGFDVKANYTRSKCRSQVVGRNVFLLGPEWALCGYDAPHLFSASVGYDLPLGPGQRWLGNASGALNRLVGGWRINVIESFNSGPPITIPCNVVTTTGSGCNALLTGEPLYPKNQSFEQWLNPAAFKNPPVATAIGQTDLAPLGGPQDQARGPSFQKRDFSLFKTFTMNASRRFVFRLEIFNLTNRVNFSAPGYNSGGAGLPVQPGVLDFSNTTNFGRITDLRLGLNDQRQIQLALKYYW
jgi:hypothetical protein